jgi:hypothetical protein
MPSRADASRAAVEWALRLVTLGALGTVLWRWTRPTPPTSPAVEVREAADTAALTRWTTTAVPAGHLAFAGAPDATTRDWLRALGAAGMRVSWSSERAPALAASAWAAVDPAGGVRVDVAAPAGTAVAVGDALAASAGALDTVRVAATGASLVAPAADEALVARAGATAATLPAPRPPRLGAVVVLGAAGWEAKFVAAALEERGWPVRLRVAVAPGLDVTQAAPNATLSPDTATTAAVVVLDSAAVDAATAARLARYVRDGGGLVLAGDGAATPALRALAPGGVGAVSHGVIGAIDGAAPQRGLELLPVQPLRADGVALERRGADVAVAARRVGAGRVVQVGYAETWRWRMAAPDEAPAAHRAWWTRVVGAAAYAPTADAPAPNDTGETQSAPAVSHTRSSSNDPAPLAGAIAALGPPSAAPSTARGRTPTGPRPSDGALAALAGAALLAEVASRRMRGAR